MKRSIYSKKSKTIKLSLILNYQKFFKSIQIDYILKVRESTFYMNLIPISLPITYFVGNIGGNVLLAGKGEKSVVLP